MAEFVPGRLTQARKMRSMNMADLARAIGVRRQSISQFESAAVSPSGQTVASMASVLRVPLSFFTKPFSIVEGSKQSPPSFRSMASAKQRDRDKAESEIEIVVSIYSDLSKLVRFPDLNIPQFDIPSLEGLSDDKIETYAAETRKHFDLGSGPISDLTLLLENKGIIVVSSPMDDGLDGLSQWFYGRPFVLVDSNQSCARMRFSLAHELGHLILHRDLLDESDLLDSKRLKMIENQANKFASAFLLPEDSLASEVFRTDWDSLIALKARWKVSIQAIMYRLREMGQITENQYTRLNQMVSIKKARRVEPLDDKIPREKPRLVGKVVELLDSRNVVKLEDFPSMVRLHPSDLEGLTGIKASMFSQNRIQNAVENLIQFPGRK